MEVGRIGLRFSAFAPSSKYEVASGPWSLWLLHMHGHSLLMGRVMFMSDRLLVAWGHLAVTAQDGEEPYEMSIHCARLDPIFWPSLRSGAFNYQGFGVSLRI